MISLNGTIQKKLYRYGGLGFSSPGSLLTSLPEKRREQDAPPAEIERRRLPGEDPGDETHRGAGGRPSAPIGGRQTLRRDGGQ